MNLFSRILLLVAMVVLIALHPPTRADDRFEEAPINYSESTPDNPVSALQSGLADGSITLQRDDETGYLKAVLDHLDVPEESQMLVFSKTSLQQHQINPDNPRAVYFNDDVYVGTVPGADLVEISVSDAQLGAVFYSFSQWGDKPPVIQQQTDTCLQCHASSLTRGIPGHLVRSVFTNAKGFPILKAGTEVTTQNVPFEERWGGWYVTGTHGDARHRGNSFATETEYGADLDVDAGANWTTLEGKIDTSKYLSPHSDLVALMVLEHQTEMHNLFTRANFDGRRALHDQAVMDKILEREDEGLSDSTRRRIDNAAHKLVDYMLFTEEAWLDEPIAGSSDFVRVFMDQGPRDKKGRSLRDLDLQRRLFKYPLSYLIYSPQFLGLPEEMKTAIYQRLWDVLTGAATLERRHYPPSPEQCQAIREILIDTLSDLPDYWTRG